MAIAMASISPRKSCAQQRDGVAVAMNTTVLCNEAMTEVMAINMRIFIVASGVDRDVIAPSAS